MALGKATALRDWRRVALYVRTGIDGQGRGGRRKRRGLGLAVDLPTGSPGGRFEKSSQADKPVDLWVAIVVYGSPCLLQKKCVVLVWCPL